MGRILIGNVLDALDLIPDESIYCIVTSPPFWGLRAYAGEQDVIFGGDSKSCQHDFSLTTPPRRQRSGDEKRGVLQAGSKGSCYDSPKGGICVHCGAWRGGYGHNPIADCGAWTAVYRDEPIIPCSYCYICQTITIFRALRRVLRKDGTIFWNIGDSYASPQKGTGGRSPLQDHHLGSRFSPLNLNLKESRLKPKDACLVPMRVALAAWADGWWMRSDIVYCKRSPMPESVKDRPVRSKESILILTKSRRAFWDMDAVRIPHKSPLRLMDIKDTDKPRRKRTADMKSHGKEGRMAPEPGEEYAFHPLGRSIRDVWTITPDRMSRGHSAVFPVALPATCIKVASPEKACAKCGKGWKRVVESGYVEVSRDSRSGSLDGKNRRKFARSVGFRPDCNCYGDIKTMKACPICGKEWGKAVVSRREVAFNLRVRKAAQGGRGDPQAIATEEEIKGYDEGAYSESGLDKEEFYPLCSCIPVAKSIVLDCFAGSGTTLAAAEFLGRSWIGIDLAEEYLPVIKQKISDPRVKKKIEDLRDNPIG